MRTDGYYETKAKQERSGKIDKEKLKQAVAQKPDAYPYELAQPFGCTPQAVFLMLRNLNIALKKTFSYCERSQEKRREYSARPAEISVSKRVYVDECGVNTCLAREYERLVQRKAYRS